MERVRGSSPLPARYPRDGFASSQTRRRSLPHTPRTDAELLARDRQLADFELLADKRLVEIRKLERAASEHAGQIELMSADRARLTARVEELTGEVDRLSSELERMKNTPLQAGWPPFGPSSPSFQHSSPFSMQRSSPLPRRCSPVRSAVITELKQLLENNQVRDYYYYYY